MMQPEVSQKDALNHTMVGRSEGEDFEGEKDVEGEKDIKNNSAAVYLSSVRSK